LRQQTEKHEHTNDDGLTRLRPSRCLSDFVAPKGIHIAIANNEYTACDEGQKHDKKSGLPSSGADYVGLFAVTAGLGVDRKEAEFLAAHDDYSAILFKALADRLAEALAEMLHQRVRTDLWGYAPDETLDVDALVAERYRGIRPAPGYPACPDHRVKRDMFELLNCADIGMHLTDSLAMTPAASVSGFYLSHPEARYFNVGKIGADQVADLARRSGAPESEVRRALAPHL